MTAPPQAPAGSSPYLRRRRPHRCPRKAPAPMTSSAEAPAGARPMGAHLATLSTGSRSMVVNNVQLTPREGAVIVRH